MAYNRIGGLKQQGKTNGSVVQYCVIQILSPILDLSYCYVFSPDTFQSKTLSFILTSAWRRVNSARIWSYVYRDLRLFSPVWLKAQKTKNLIKLNKNKNKTLAAAP